MRNIAEVIGQLKKVMPKQSHSSLDAILQTAMFRAPEIQHLSWADLQQAVLYGVGFQGVPVVIEPGQEWKAEALAVFSGKTTTEMNAEGLFDWRD